MHRLCRCTDRYDPALAGASLFKKAIDNSDLFKTNPDLTNVKGWTMGFIYRMQEKGLEVYQKDIEQEFNISRSTATELLQNLEQNDFLTREVSLTDGRLKRNVLKDKAIKLQEAVIETLNQVENKLLDGFSREEQEILFNYLGRIRKNLEGKD